MPPVYPSHLYIRIDRDLREALAAAADEAGETVSTFVRRRLRSTLNLASSFQDVPASTGQHAAARVARDMRSLSEPARKVAQALASGPTAISTRNAADMASTPSSPNEEKP